MPFDYNSFFQGVQTGLRLGRPPEGRKPPAPSGRYILTESGDYIITEKEWSKEVEYFNYGPVYSATRYNAYGDDAEPVEHGMLTMYTETGEGNNTLFFTYALIPEWSQESITRVIFARSESFSPEVYGRYLYNTFEGDGGATPITGVVLNENWITYSSVKYVKVYEWPVVRPDDALIFHGSELEFLSALARIKNYPMITEGG